MFGKGYEFMYSVVVPCYNEEKNLNNLMQRFDAVYRAVSQHGREFELVLVDNGSTDGSPARISAIAQQRGWVKCVRVEVNQGYGYGILQGLKACSGDYLFWHHADLQMPPESLLDMIEILETAEDPQNIFCKGEREGRSLLDRFFTRGMSIFESIYLGVPLHDINGQPTGFPKAFFESWTDPPYDFSLDLFAYAMAVKNHLSVKRVKVVMVKRAEGHSSWNTGMISRFQLIANTIRYSRALKSSWQRQRGSV